MAFSKIRLLFGSVLLSLFLLFLFSKPAHAGCLFNIADLNEDDLRICLQTSENVAFITYPNKTFGPVKRALEIIANEFPGTTVEIRPYNDTAPWTADQINAIVAASQSVNTGGPILLRPFNEWLDHEWVWVSLGPAFDEAGNPLPGLDARINAFIGGMDQFVSLVNQSGNNIILGDMLDYWHFKGTHEYEAFLQRFRELNSGTGYYQYLSSINGFVGINGYWNIDPNTGSVDFGRLGAISLDQVLSRLPPGTPWRFSEFGYMYSPDGGVARPIYDNPQFMENAVTAMVGWLASNPQYVPSFVGFDIFTKDPHCDNSPERPCTGSPITAAFIDYLSSSNPDLLEGLQSLFDKNEPFNQESFDQWIQQLINSNTLIECTNDEGHVIGYAPTQSACDSQFGLPQFQPAPDNQCSAGGSIPPSGILRPYPCKNCTLNVPQGTKACADPFTLYKKTTWACGELESCGDSWLKYSGWRANFTLDTKKTKVPFAGYHKIIADEEGNTDNLNNYLADYFTGTALYDGRSYDLKNPKDVQLMIKQAGVIRKLAPLEVQDQLRTNMILSGHNYQITDGKATKHMRDWWPEAPMPPRPYPAGRFPPDKNAPFRPALYTAWLTTEWGRLWQRIPLFTREDSPGKVTLSIEHYPGELSSANSFGRDKTPYSAEFPMAFPHLARLHDASQFLEDMLTTEGHDSSPQISTSRPESKILLAQARSENQVLDIPSPALLAQGEELEEETEPPPEPDPTWFYVSPGATYSRTGIDQYQIGWQVTFGQNQSFPNYSSYDFGDFGFQVFINGQPMGGTSFQPGSSFAANPTFTNDNYGVSPTTLSLRPGDSFTIAVTVTGGTPWNLANQDQLINQSFQTTCKVLPDGSIDCPTVANITQVVTDPGCGNQSNLDPGCSGNNPEPDHNPNDAACCNASANVEINDYRIVAFDNQEAYDLGCQICKDDETPEECDERHNRVRDHTMTRKVKVSLRIPYLENIWEDTAEDKWGVFNIFKPAAFPAFPDNDALSKIRYTQKTPQGLEEWIDWATSPFGLTPSEGKLYYPYLGGIHQTKKCISEHFLLPPELQSEVNYCDFWDEFLQSQPSYIPEQEDSFKTDPGDQLDLMDCQNADFNISDQAKANAIVKANQSWPGNLLEEYWEGVATESKAHGWNPACVIALWIEESGASGLIASGRAKYSLGCESATSSDPATNLSQSLECFFSRQEHEYYRDFTPGSREWWLVYAKGPGNNDVFDGPQANFPTNLFYWYQRLTE